MVKVADGRVVGDNILVGEVTGDKLSYLFQSGSLVSIGSAAAWVSFPVAYGQIPAVTTAPGTGLNFARVLQVTSTQFQWISNVPGSASWIAFGVK